MAPRANAVVAVLAFGGIVVSLMQTLVIPIVPELPKLLNAPASDTAWAVTATLLAAAVAVPMTGRLGDMYGKRRMLLVSLVLLVAGSVTAALSDSLAPMIVGATTRFAPARINFRSACSSAARATICRAGFRSRAVSTT